MQDFRLRTDLERERLGGLSLALGLVPRDLPIPREGYVVDYVTAEEDEPDGYHFHVTVSHERLSGLLDQLFRLLSGEVYPILEIGSRDAYRTVDVWMAALPITRTDFLTTWAAYREFLLEDGSVSVGANCEEPSVEIFVDHWKGIGIHIPLLMREDAESILEAMGLEELAEPWLDVDEEDGLGMDMRPVLDLSEPDLPDVEDVLLDLRELWRLELNVDPETNVDDAGRALGVTLWYAVVILRPRVATRDGAYAMVWLTAPSLRKAEQLAEEAVEGHADYRFDAIHSIDRVPHDERPDELGDLAPRPTRSEVHLCTVEPWLGSGGDRPESGRPSTGGGERHGEPDRVD